MQALARGNAIKDEAKPDSESGTEDKGNKLFEQYLGLGTDNSDVQFTGTVNNTTIG
jgi:hypothetical protein